MCVLCYSLHTKYLVTKGRLSGNYATLITDRHLMSHSPHDPLITTCPQVKPHRKLNDNVPGTDDKVGQLLGY